VNELINLLGLSDEEESKEEVFGVGYDLEGDDGLPVKLYSKQSARALMLLSLAIGILVMISYYWSR